MANYDLNIVFTAEQLGHLYATESRVVLAKGTPERSPNVAWQVFMPSQMNDISWNDEYGIYSSTTEITNGTRINPSSVTPIGIDKNSLYTLENNGAILGPTTGGQPDTFGLLNNNSNNPLMTVGLFQNVFINGDNINGNAVSATPLLFQSTAFMDSSTDIYIWIQSEIESNSIISRIASPVSILRYGKRVHAMSIKYDDRSRVFMNIGWSDFAEGAIEHIQDFL